jgi:hypothetical protein
MYLMYVDESGDPGMGGSPSRIFVLSGLVVHESQWRPLLDHIVEFRRRMKGAFGLRIREELHAAHLITTPGDLKRIPRFDRLTIIRHFADELAKFPGVSIINVVVVKEGKPQDFDVAEQAWRALLQRFENTIHHGNFPGPADADQRGLVFPDGSPLPRIVRLMRRLRHFNPVPSRFGPARNLPLVRIVEDPVFRDSAQSLLIQAADLAAFLLYQREQPNAYMRKKGGAAYFERLSPILCRQAAPTDPLGVVRL